MICSLSKQLFLKPFPEDNLFCCTMLGNGTSISKDGCWTGIEASVITWRFTYDMKLAIRPNAFSLLLTLEHMSKICSSNWSSKSVKTPSSVSFVLDLIEEPPKCDSVCVSELNKRCHFPGLFFILLFLNHVKSVWNVECNTLYPQYPNYERMSNVQSNFRHSESQKFSKKLRK